MRQLKLYAGVYTTVTRGDVTDREEEWFPSDRLAAPLALKARATVYIPFTSGSGVSARERGPVPRLVPFAVRTEMPV